MALQGDYHIKAMFGEKAVHVPAWIKVQNQGKAGVLFVGASRLSDMCYGSDKTHCLVVGEIIVRPHLIVASDHLQGAGISGLVREGGDIDDWAERGLVLFDGLGQIKKKG